MHSTDSHGSWEMLEAATQTRLFAVPGQTDTGTERQHRVNLKDGRDRVRRI